VDWPARCSEGGRWRGQRQTGCGVRALRGDASWRVGERGQGFFNRRLGGLAGDGQAPSRHLRLLRGTCPLAREGGRRRGASRADWISTGVSAAAAQRRRCDAQQLREGAGLCAVRGREEVGCEEGRVTPARTAAAPACVLHLVSGRRPDKPSLFAASANELLFAQPDSHRSVAFFSAAQLHTFLAFTLLWSFDLLWL
jgi:hypothetical protein